MGKFFKFMGNSIIDPIPEERDDLVRQNARLRLQNEFLRGLLECHNIKIPESMDDYLETKEIGLTEESYIVGQLDILSTELRMLHQILIYIKMNME